MTPSRHDDEIPPAPKTPVARRDVERRRSPRYACNFSITMHWGDAVLEGRVADIGLEGMFVELDKPLWIGATFMAQVRLDAPLQLECVVRRIEPFRGMALTYSFPGETERAAMMAALEQLRPA